MPISAAVAFLAALALPGATGARRADEAPRSGGDWPAYRCDNARTGVSPQPLQTPLWLQWTYVPRHPPRPAWPEPGKEMNRLPFDYAHHAVANGMVFFGSSADHKVYALDLSAGEERWSFFTEGPIRFAPAVSGDRVFVGSDDGCAYCLRAEDGALIWRFRAGPRDERLMGNEQMISRWPLRSGVLVDGDVVYLTAGMWSSDGVYVYALRADDGSVVWKNDTSGHIYMGLPHSAMEGIAGLAPQGYLALYKDTLIVPQGRAEPAAFDAKTGGLVFCQNAATKLHHAGGAWVTAARDLVFGERRPVQADRHVSLEEAQPAPGEGLIAWDYRTGQQRLAIVGKHRAVVLGDTMYATGDGAVSAIDLPGLLQVARRFYASGEFDPNVPRGHAGGAMFIRGSRYPWVTSKVVPVYPRPVKWQTPLGRTYALILAGGTLVAGGQGVVTAVDADTGKVLWQTSVEGEARGLAVAGRRLLVGLSTGEILCFGPTRVEEPKTVRPRTTAPRTSAEARGKAESILADTKVRAGYCLMLGVGDGRLAAELARQSELVVYCIEPDRKKVAAAREMLDAAGLYGVRVVVHGGTPRNLPYADYFANLIVVDEQTLGGARRWSGRELYRVLHPYGGIAYVAPASATSANVGAMRRRLREAGIPADEIRAARRAVLVVRGKLPGADEWTHPYGDAGRSAASKDRLVRLPLTVLWFGRPGPARMVSRHWRAPTPVFADGRLFVCGEHDVTAVDAYNGRELWRRELPKVGRYSAKYRGGNIVTDGAHVYAVQGTKCLQLDAATGETQRTYEPPEEATQLPVLDNPIDIARGGKARARPVPNEVAWEFLAVTDDCVLGSVGLPNFSWSWWPEAYPECKYVFALGKADGSVKWVYRADESVSPNGISIADGRVYLIDRTSEAELTRAKRRGEKVSVSAGLRALDVETGGLVWETRQDVDGTLLWKGGDVLLITGGRKASAYISEDGSLLWSRRLPGQPYPAIVGDTIYLYPRAFDLRTGEWKKRVQPVTGEEERWLFQTKAGCGAVSACPTTLLFRSGAAGFYDIAGDSGTHWLGQVRSSCWINMIPAGGLVLMPEGASSCTCPYNFQTSLALAPDTRFENWSLFAAEPEKRSARIRHLAVNFGAVGDQRDSEGRLWLGYPRPFRPGVLMIPLLTSNAPEYRRRNADEVSVRNTDAPWVYASWCAGLERAELDLVIDRPAAAPHCDAAPEIDGRLDDECWDGRASLTFTTDTQVVEPRAVAYLRHDDENLYVGFRRRAEGKQRKSMPWRMLTNGRDAPVWTDDSLNVRLWDPAKVVGLYLYVSASGATFDGLTNRSTPSLVGTNERWNGKWSAGAQAGLDAWTAEIAIPWQTLSDAGMEKNRLQVYLENTNHTGVGAPTVHYKHRTWRRLHLFGRLTPVSFAEPAEGERRSYRIVMHFAELDEVKPGQRVFDVRIQGRTVINGLDVVREAGGRNVALVREISGVRARDSVTLELIPASEEPPIISGLEVYEEAE
ncbi:MAG: PQQ-binding-like beta-propeller repeat protein [Armatimonadota bacterium]